MDSGMDNFKFIQTTYQYNVRINSYHDPATDDFYLFSSNGVHCVLKDRKYIYFYRDTTFIVKTKARYMHVNLDTDLKHVVMYIELSIFLHVNANVIDSLVKILTNMNYSDDLTHMLHPKEMLYYFNFDVDSHVFNEHTIEARNLQVSMFKHEGEFYYNNNSFFKINPSLSNFIQHYTLCLTELFTSLETSKILFTHDLKWSVINLVYDTSTEELHISSKAREKYKNSPQVADELVPESRLTLSESAMYEYVYEYLFKRSVEDLKPDMQKIFDDGDMSLTTDYKDILKIVDMMTI